MITFKSSCDFLHIINVFVSVVFVILFTFFCIFTCDLSDTPMQLDSTLYGSQVSTHYRNNYHTLEVFLINVPN